MNLPDKVMTVLKESAASAHIQHMHEAKSNTASANNILRHSAVRMVDEPTPANARAVDKILRTPR